MIDAIKKGYTWIVNKVKRFWYWFLVGGIVLAAPLVVVLPDPGEMVREYYLYPAINVSITETISYAPDIPEMLEGESWASAFSNPGEAGFYILAFQTTRQRHDNVFTPSALYVFGSSIQDVQNNFDNISSPAREKIRNEMRNLTAKKGIEIARYKQVLTEQFEKESSTTKLQNKIINHLFPIARAGEVASETWQTASGTAWTIAQGADNDWTLVNERISIDDDISSNEGRMGNFSSFLSRGYLYISAKSELDQEARVDVRHTVGASDGFAEGFIARRTADNTYFFLGWSEDNSVNEFAGTTAGLKIAKRISGTGTVLAEKTLARTWTNQHKSKAKIQDSGSNVLLKVALWDTDASESEPGYDDATLGLEYTDAPSSITSSGNPGLRGEEKDEFIIYDNWTLNDLAVATARRILWPQ